MVQIMAIATSMVTASDTLVSKLVAYRLGVAVFLSAFLAMGIMVNVATLASSANRLVLQPGGGIAAMFSPATLDPRPDSETLVEAVIACLSGEGRRHAPLGIVDLGTGSGALLVALLRAMPRARGLGIDVCADALDVARRNALHAGVADRADWLMTSWFDGVQGTFDIIVSNPPYIRRAEIADLQAEVAEYDPRLALDGGPDGLDAYKAITARAGRHLASGGWIFLETGAGQSADVVAMLTAEGLAPGDQAVLRFHDLGGHVRCVAMRHRFLGEIKKK